MNLDRVKNWKNEMNNHLENELLPFWKKRCLDAVNGGYITQFDKDGNDTGEDEKSLLAHMRTVYSLSLARRHGFDKEGVCLNLARQGVYYAVRNYWDNEYGGFYWLFNRKNEVIIDKKIIYGLSFAIYALSTFTTVSGDNTGLEYAEKCFDLLQVNCADTFDGGYWEMFNRDWSICSPGSGGGDRKTLDVHMHLMEAFTALYECSGKELHRRKLQEIIDILVKKIVHPEYGSGIPQFFKDWTVAPQIKFDIIWGWDRFTDDKQEKENVFDNTSYGHNVEFFWLLLDALKVLGTDLHTYDDLFAKILKTAVNTGIDRTYGGVYVEGSHDGKRVYDKCKEFWQQAEFLTGMLDAYILYNDEKYLDAYDNVHNFVMKHMIKHEVGEWLPLLSREGEPVWTHMSHSWKVNYHTIRASVLSIDRMKRIIDLFEKD